jgi:hypothetical protein
MRNKRAFGFLLPLVLVLPLALSGCSSDSGGGVFAASTGQLSVEIHDRVEARRLEGEWSPLAGEFPHRFDLLQLQNGRTRVLGAGAVPSGVYDRLRLHLSAVHLVMRSGEQVDVPIPGAGRAIRTWWSMASGGTDNRVTTADRVA